MKPIQIQISNDIQLKINELPYLLFQAIKQDLTMDNPAYNNALRLNLPTTNINSKIKLYSVDESTIKIPRGYGKRLIQKFREYQVQYSVSDNRLTLPPVEFNSKIKLRDYQKHPVDALVKHKQGGIVAGCGSGKTQIMLEIMARIKQPALWVCHTYELLNQTLDRACEVFDMKPEEVGIIADGKVRVGDKLTFALIQTLYKAELTELTGKFGAVFVDEAHHLAARSFFYPIGQFPALYRLWASATPERGDGLTGMIYACGGPVLYEINQDELPTITPGLVVVETQYSRHYPPEEYSKLITDLINNKARNNLIVHTIAAEAPDNYSLVLSDRIEHLETLQIMLQEALPHMTIEILTGNIKKNARVDIMERVQNQQIDILLATQLAREGLDIIHLNRLFLATPKRAAGATQQEVGRIMRPCSGKKDAIVFDFWDSQSPILKAQFWRRRDVYQKLGVDCRMSRVMSRVKRQVV